MKHYLSICAIYRDEAPYLREWLSLHRLAGVEHFYLYNNGSTDEHREALAPYLDEGIAELLDWDFYPGQLRAYDHCLAERRDESRWIAFVDIDEFLFSPTIRPLPEILARYEQAPGVVANWAIFGTSGHAEKPEGLVIESYLRRTDNQQANRHVKSIVDPRRAQGPGGNPHFFRYRDGNAVDETGAPLEGPPFSFTESVHFDLLRVNHYYTKSEQEFRDKLAKPKAHGPEYQVPVIEQERLARQIATLNEVEDRTILAYLPALREALEALQ